MIILLIGKRKLNLCIFFSSILFFFNPHDNLPLVSIPVMFINPDYSNVPMKLAVFTVCISDFIILLLSLMHVFLTGYLIYYSEFISLLKISFELLIYAQHLSVFVTIALNLWCSLIWSDSRFFMQQYAMYVLVSHIICHPFCLFFSLLSSTCCSLI